MSEGSWEMAKVYALCTAVVGLMAALAPEMATTEAGYIIFAAVAVTGGMFFYFVLRDGLGWLRAGLLVVLLGGTCFGLVYWLLRGILWCLDSYLASVIHGVE